VKHAQSNIVLSTILTSSESGYTYLYGSRFLESSDGNLGSKSRHKKNAVMPFFVVGGPKSPKNCNLFILPLLIHLAACQHCGIKIWNCVKHAILKMYSWLLFGTVDTVAMAYLTSDKVCRSSWQKRMSSPL
ncbi:hypothetical protein MPER_01305, partial [Moniliophthora perniciosa FA553]